MSETGMHETLQFPRRTADQTRRDIDKIRNFTTVSFLMVKKYAKQPRFSVKDEKLFFTI